MSKKKSSFKEWLWGSLVDTTILVVFCIGVIVLIWGTVLVVKFMFGDFVGMLIALVILIFLFYILARESWKNYKERDV